MFILFLQTDPQKFACKNPNPNKMCSTMLNSDSCLIPLKEDSLSEVEHLPGLSLADEEYFHEPFLCYLKNKNPATGK